MNVAVAVSLDRLFRDKTRKKPLLTCEVKRLFFCINYQGYRYHLSAL